MKFKNFSRNSKICGFVSTICAIYLYPQPPYFLEVLAAGQGHSELLPKDVLCSNKHLYRQEVNSSTFKNGLVPSFNAFDMMGQPLIKTPFSNNNSARRTNAFDVMGQPLIKTPFSNNNSTKRTNQNLFPSYLNSKGENNTVGISHCEISASHQRSSLEYVIKTTTNSSAKEEILPKNNIEEDYSELNPIVLEIQNKIHPIMDLIYNQYENKFTIAIHYKQLGNCEFEKKYGKIIYDQIFYYIKSNYSEEISAKYFNVIHCQKYLGDFFKQHLCLFLADFLKCFTELSYKTVQMFFDEPSKIFYPFIFNFLFFLDPCWSLYDQLVEEKSKEELFDVFDFCSILQNYLDRNLANEKSKELVQRFINFHRNDFIKKVIDFPSFCKKVISKENNMILTMKAIIKHFEKNYNSFEEILNPTHSKSTRNDLSILGDKMHPNSSYLSLEYLPNSSPGFLSVAEKGNNKILIELWGKIYQIFLMVYLIDGNHPKYLDESTTVVLYLKRFLNISHCFLLFNSVRFVLSYKLGLFENNLNYRGLFLFHEILNIWMSREKKNVEILRLDPSLKIPSNNINVPFIIKACRYLNIITKEYNNTLKLNPDKQNNNFKKIYADYSLKEWHSLFHNLYCRICFTNDFIPSKGRVFLPIQ